jgi:hypothetical protein
MLVLGMENQLRTFLAAVRFHIPVMPVYDEGTAAHTPA